MKQKITLMSLVLLLGLAVFVSAVDVPSLPGETSVDTTSTNINIQFQKGWNLIGMWALDDSLSELINNKSVEYVFIFDNLNKNYVQLAPNRESGKLGSILGPGIRPGYFLNAGVWVYVEEDYLFSPQSIDDPTSIDVLKMERGWNIFSITPDMIGKSLNDIEGDCQITSAYLWDEDNQQWGTIFNLMNDRDILETEGGVGKGLVVKVNEDCQLSTASTTPPAIPVECDDNDNGLNYGKRGTAFSTKHVNSLGEITTSESSFGEGDSCCTSCDNTEDGDEGEYLLEGYCDELGVVRFKKYDCPNGCKEGVCLGDSGDDKDYVIKSDISPYVFDKMGSNGISNTEFGISFKHYEAIYEPYAEGNVYVFENNEDASSYYASAKQEIESQEIWSEVEIVDGMEALLFSPESGKNMWMWKFENKVIITQYADGNGDNVAEAYFSKYS